MTRQTRSVAVLLADISKSSGLYEQLGNQAAREIIGYVLSRLSDLTGRFDGKAVKTAGDAVMCIFDSSDNALEAAAAMQAAMGERLSERGKWPSIQIHIGIHYGAVIIENNDIFGDVVNVAARVADYANPHQIVATRAVINQLRSSCRRGRKFLSRITAKNISGEIELYEVLFEEQQTMMVLDSRQMSDMLGSSLCLVRDGQMVVIDAQRPAVSVGREDFNDISIKCSWVSRTHAYIENRSGTFMIRDKSTNGTYVYPEDAEPAYINKSEHPLTGRGIIVFGRKKAESSPADMDILQYSVNNG